MDGRLPPPFVNKIEPSRKRLGSIHQALDWRSGCSPAVPYPPTKYHHYATDLTLQKGTFCSRFNGLFKSRFCELFTSLLTIRPCIQ